MSLCRGIKEWDKIGKWYILNDADDHGISRGQILRMFSSDTVVVQIYSWVFDEPIREEIYRIDDMDGCFLYDSFEGMIADCVTIESTPIIQEHELDRER